MAEPSAPRDPTRYRSRAESLGAALRLVHTEGPIRRRDLTARLGLSRSAVGALIEELEDLALVTVETSPPPAGETGRPSHVVVSHPTGPVGAAVQIRADSYRVGLVALGGVVVHSTARALPRPSTPERVLSAVASSAAAAVAAGNRACVGLGVAVPSAVSRSDQRALAALHLGWPSGVPVREMLSESLAGAGVDLAVHAGNDANLAALAEHRHGAGAGASDMLFVTTGQQGVGGALVTGGRLFTGSAGYALEVGHLTVEPRGRLCHCGNRGCLDVEADPRALLRLETAAGDEREDEEEDVEGAASRMLEAVADDADARAVVRRVVDRLGAGLAALVNLFNPDRIVLGGLHAELYDAMPERMAAVVRRRSFLDAASEVPIVPASLGRDAILLGAGELALQPLLDDPRLIHRDGHGVG